MKSQIPEESGAKGPSMSRVSPPPRSPHQGGVPETPSIQEAVSPRKSLSSSPSTKPHPSMGIPLKPSGLDEGRDVGTFSNSSRPASATSATLRNLRDDAVPNPLALAVDRILFEYQLRQQSKFHFNVGKSNQSKKEKEQCENELGRAAASPRKKAASEINIAEEFLAPEVLLRGPSSTLLSEATSRPRRPMSARLAASPTFRAFQRLQSSSEVAFHHSSGDGAEATAELPHVGATNSPLTPSRPHQPSPPTSSSKSFAAPRSIVTASQEEALAASRRFSTLFETAPVEKYPYHLCHVNEATDRRDLQSWLATLQRGEEGKKISAKWRNDDDSRWGTSNGDATEKWPATVSATARGTNTSPSTTLSKTLSRQASSGRLRGAGVSGKSATTLSPPRLGPAPHASSSSGTLYFAGIKVTNPVEQRLFAFAGVGSS